MEQSSEDVIVSKVTKHFDTQINWLADNLGQQIKSVENRIEVESHLYRADVNNRFSLVWHTVNWLKEKKWDVEARTVGISVLVTSVLISAAWAMVK